ncbi:hypothetical protein HOLleu_21653 [Holothuria leucospilota]|uniref:Uncharacterized protein n=1 Tax=Holothuria leucospilota TaxID=206669 RepID=A0A9Q1BY85_HOLLE|nr:hypothetical protein HOLleu_21653 [Holothuria leucospilota]
MAFTCETEIALTDSAACGPFYRNFRMCMVLSNLDSAQGYGRSFGEETLDRYFQLEEVGIY